MRLFVTACFTLLFVALSAQADIITNYSLHGNGQDVVTSMHRRADGSMLICGYTTSTAFDNLPEGVTPPPDSTGENAFVGIVSADLMTLQHIVFIAGIGDDRANDVDVLPNGHVCIAGQTNSADFPVKGTPVGQVRGGGMDGFVAVYSDDLATQLVGLLLAGNKDDVANGIAAVNTGAIVVVGSTASDAGIRGQKNYDDTLAGAYDAYIWVLHSSYSYVEFFTYVGGQETDAFNRVTLDHASNIVAIGTSTSQDYFIFPRKTLVLDGGTDPYTGEPTYKEVGRDPYGPSPFGGASDVILTKFNLSGDPVFSTFFGGNGADEGVDILVNSDNDNIIIGNTTSTDFEPVTTSNPYGGGYDGFIATITKDGFRSSGLAYLGGAKDDRVGAIVGIDNNFSVVVGRTESTDFPVVGTGAISPVGSGPFGFMMTTGLAGTTFSTLLNLEGDLVPTGVALDNLQDVYIAGSRILPALKGAPVKPSDGFVAKWSTGSIVYHSPMSWDKLCVGVPVNVTWTTTGLDVKTKMFVDLSVDSGKTWRVMGSGITALSYSFDLPGDIDQNSVCFIRIRSERGHHAQSEDPLTVGMLPVILEGPHDLTSCTKATITMTVTSNVPSANFQWRKDNVEIAGANLATYTVENAQADASGLYTVVITNACGMATSSGATVVVTDTPLIDEQPSAGTKDEGTTVEMHVIARGVELTYKWSKNDGPIRGTNPTTATLTLDKITAADDGLYVCEITSSCGGSITTEGAQLKVSPFVSVYDKVAASSQLHVWPQPTSDVVYVDGTATAWPTVMILRNMQGQEVAREHITSAQQGPTGMRVSQLPAGIYVLELQTLNGGSQTPIVVIH